ncbi:50S ribosome-binding GTPase [Candidatus Woesearchaeota archaeon]|nr:50S ribosome-binding GTPase [Candidatus Woesearchaeota archaeon]
MSFQKILQVEKHDFYIDLAFASATKAAKAMKSKHFKLPRHEIIRKVEITKLSVINRLVSEHLTKLADSFPDIDLLSVFYYELIRSTLDIGLFKKSIAALRWIIKTSDTLTTKYVGIVNQTKNPDKMMQYRREYYGRISSLFKQTKETFVFLHEARKTFRSYPIVKDMPTVAICGFPNIGKTTLLSKLTSSKPEIADYAFTTKSLNMGYAEVGHKKIQFIDTPGTLNRFDKMNFIERQAYLAAKYCANVIIYIYDLSEPYSLRDQQLLLQKFKEFNKPIIIYLSKTDILPKEIVSQFKGDKDIILTIKELNSRISTHIKELETKS